MILPTVGRMLWYWPDGRPQLAGQAQQPLAAQIAHVHDDRHVTIGYLDAFGVACSAMCVPLWQEGDPQPELGFVEWMPYQKWQAAKTEQLEAVIADGCTREPIER